MTEFARHIFLDIYLVSLLVLVVGLYVFRYFANEKKLTFYSSGKVWVEPFNRTDLIVCFLFMVFILNVFWNKQTSIPEIDPKTVTAAIWLDFIVKMVVIFLLVVCLGLVRNINLSKLFGLVPKQWVRLLLLIPGISLISIFGVYYVSVLVKTHALSNFSQESGLQTPVKLFLESADHPVMRMSMIFSACVAAPLIEEIVFRGYLYGVLKRFGEKYFAAIISSAMFALMHANLFALAPLFLLALVLVLVYEFTGSLWAPIGIHACFNSFSVYQMIQSTHGHA